MGIEVDGVEIYSNLAKEMNAIYLLHFESGNEAHSKAGAIVRKELVKSLESKKTNWTTKIVNGKRLIVKGGSHSMGERFSRDTGKKLAIGMRGFIQWRTYASTGTTVVGGLMKNSYTEKRENGKVVGRIRVHGVTQESVDILEKISSGVVGKAKWKDYTSGKLTLKSMENFSGTHKPTRFIEEGKRTAITKISSRMEKWYSDAVKNRDNIRRENELDRI